MHVKDFMNDDSVELIKQDGCAYTFSSLIAHKKSTYTA